MGLTAVFCVFICIVLEWWKLVSPKSLAVKKWSFADNFYYPPQQAEITWKKHLWRTFKPREDSTSEECLGAPCCWRLELLFWQGFRNLVVCFFQYDNSCLSMFSLAAGNFHPYLGLRTSNQMVSAYFTVYKTSGTKIYIWFALMGHRSQCNGMCTEARRNGLVRLQREKCLTRSAPS